MSEAASATAAAVPKPVAATEVPEEKDVPAEQKKAQISGDHEEADPPADLGTQDVDAELEEMKQRLAQMEAESAVVKDGNSIPTGQTPATNPSGQPIAAVHGVQSSSVDATAPTRIPLTQETITDVDARSIYVGNVDYAATGDQLSAHFADCGTINRVTIMCNKATGMPKGFAYIEFEDLNAAQNALILNESTFLGRPLKVVPKRTNIPMSFRGGYRGGRGRFTRGVRGYPRRARRSWRGRWAPY